MPRPLKKKPPSVSDGTARVKQKNLPPKTPLPSPPPLLVLFVIVERAKAEFYEDLLGGFEVTFGTVTPAAGTATSEMQRMLGLAEENKSLLLSFIRGDRAKEALDLLDEKFRTVRNGKGIAFTVPLNAVIGVTAYRMLSNIHEGKDE